MMMQVVLLMMIVFLFFAKRLCSQVLYLFILIMIRQPLQFIFRTFDILVLDQQECSLPDIVRGVIKQFKYDFFAGLADMTVQHLQNVYYLRFITCLYFL